MPPDEPEGPWPRRREREAAAEAERAAAWGARSAAESRGRGGHSDSRPTDIRSIGAARRGIGETVRAPGRPDTAAEHRRHRAAEPDAPPEERDRAARLSGELPVVPRRPAGAPGRPGDPPARPPGRPGAPGRPDGPPAGRDGPPSGRPDGPPAGRDGPPAGRPDGRVRGPAAPPPGPHGPPAPRNPAEGAPHRPDGPAHPGVAAPPPDARPGRPPVPPGGPARPASGPPLGAPGRLARPGDTTHRPHPPGPDAPRGPAPARPPHRGAVTAGAAAPGHDDAGHGGTGSGAADRGRDDRRGTGRRPADTARAGLGAALGLTAASTVLPGSGHLALRRRRTGGLILGTLLAVVAALVLLVLLTRRSTLLQNLLSTTTLTVIAGALVLGGIGWIAQIARTYALARPRTLPLAQKIVGTGTAALLCLTVAVPFGYGVELLNSQRGLLNSLFQGGGGTSAAEALGKPRLNVLLLGSDAGDGRTGTRTDTMMVASIDTRSGRTTLFSLPRNIQRAEFPPGTPAAEEFPNGFHDPSQPLSGDYLLNAVFAYGERHPEIAPPTPTPEPGMNLLHSTISYMTGLPIDYYLEVNMAGFSSMIDAVGGVTVNVGPEPIPVGGVTAYGGHTTPDRYIPPGTRTLNGEDALWFARSRRDGTDYQRMGRQRCLIQAVVSQTSATELITRFQSIAAVTRDNVSTDIPQQVLPALAVLADEGFRLESVAFDPSLPDPNSSTGYFVTADPDTDYMREVVRDAIADPPPPPDPALAAPAPAPAPSAQAPSSTATPDSSAPSPGATSAAPEPASAAPQSVAESCASSGAADVPTSEEQGAAESAEESSESE